MGQLLVDGGFECYTREPPLRSLRLGGPGRPEWDNVFVAAESALPEGLYTLSIPFLVRYSREVPLLVSSQLRAAGGLTVAVGMRIIPGNYTLDPDAGIVIGQSQGPKHVHRTRLAFEAFTSKCLDARRRSEAIDVRITNP